MLTIHIFKRTRILRKPQYYFNIKAANGEIIAQSEGYVSRMECLATTMILKDQLATAKIDVNYDK